MNTRMIFLALLIGCICIPVHSQTEEALERARLQYCGTPDPETPPPIPEPARSRPKPEGWIDYPSPEDLVGPLSEYSETTAPGRVSFYSYPKFYRNASDQLEEVDPNFVPSSDENWDYEVNKGIWSLKVQADGTFQASHEGDVFTYQFHDIGVGLGDEFESLDLGELNWSQFRVVGDSIQWTNVLPDVDLSVRYIHHMLKVDVVA